MNIKLELAFRDDAVYLNFWNPDNGKDLLCQIKNGKLYRFLYSTKECEELELEEVDFDAFAQEEISLADFVDWIRKTLNVDEWMKSHNAKLKADFEDFMKRLRSPEWDERMKKAWEEEKNKDIWKDPENGECE